MIDMLEETDALAEERLIEHTHRTIFSPQTVSSLENALVAHRLIHTLRRVLEKLDYHLTFRDTSAALKKHMREGSTRAVRKQVKKQRVHVDDSELNMVRRVKTLRAELRQRDREQLAAAIRGKWWWRKIGIRRAFAKEQEARASHVHDSVISALLPSRLHAYMHQHHKLLDSFDGTLGGCPKCVFFCCAPLIKAVKR